MTESEAKTIAKFYVIFTLIAGLAIFGALTLGYTPPQPETCQCK